MLMAASIYGHLLFLALLSIIFKVAILFLTW